MKRFGLLLPLHAIFLLFTTVTHAFTPAHLWSQRFGGTGADVGNATTMDAAGNVYLTGAFQSTVNFGGADLTSAGGYDIVLAKYDADGVAEWTQRFGSTSSDYGYGVAVDALGNVFVAGYFSGTVNFGGAGLVSAGGTDIFLAKYDVNGTHQWSQRFGGTLGDVAYSIALDGAGSVFVTGTFQGTVNFGGGNLVSAGNHDIFLAKYAANGVYQWSQRFGSTGADYGLSLAVDGSGNVLATGSYIGTVNFGGGNLISAGSGDAFLAKYNTDGIHLWSRRHGGASNESGTSVAVDGAGNVFAMAVFLGTANFGGGDLVSLGGYDICLAKYSSNGLYVWSQRFGGTGNDYGQSVAADGSGNVYGTGYFPGNIDFGGGSLVSAGSDDLFLAKFDPDGVHQWSQRFGGTNTEAAFSMAVGGNGHVCVTGYFSGATNLGGAKLTSAGTSDMFLAKYSASTGEPIVTSITDVGNDQGGKVKILFSRSGGDDTAASNPVTHYVAMRRDDPPPAGPVATATAAPLDPNLLAGWIEVGSVSAFADDDYGMIVPTAGDSTRAHGQYYSVFLIRAATGEPGVFFESPIDSGYSLDNLAPGVPQNLVFAAGQLFWSQPPTVDFDYFTVYGSDTNLFSTATVIDYTVPATLDVAASPYAFYFVTATDFSGNESAPAGFATATGVGGTPQSYVLSVSNYPNPFNPRTTVGYTVPSRGAVTVAIYDARGAFITTLVDNEDHAAGAYRLEWDGQTSGGATVSSGVYFARIEHAGSTRTKKMVLLK